MYVMEIFDGNNDLPGYRSEKDDNTVVKLGDMRKTKLTLAQ